MKKRLVFTLVVTLICSAFTQVQFAVRGCLLPLLILKYQRSSVSESMSKLQALGILKRVGSKKTGHWEIVKEDY